MGSANIDSWTDCRGAPGIRTPTLNLIGDAHSIQHKHPPAHPLIQHSATTKHLAQVCRISSAFGRILQRLRHQQALSVLALARRSQVDLVRLMQMDRGLLTPTVKELVDLAIALRIRASTLLRCLDASGPPA